MTKVYWVNLSKRRGQGFPRAGRDAPRDFHWAIAIMKEKQPKNNLKLNILSECMNQSKTIKG